MTFSLTREHAVSAIEAELDMDDADAVRAFLLEASGLKRLPKGLATRLVSLVAEVEAEGEEKPSRSIVPKKYKARYRPFHQTCGDDISTRLAEHVKVRTEDGIRVDLEKLRRFADANGCWQDKYERLNPGQQRMNVGNRLRAKVAKGHVVVWA